MRKIIKELNIGVYDCHFDREFQFLDTDSSGELDVSMFKQLVRNLKEHRDELSQLFSKYDDTNDVAEEDREPGGPTYITPAKLIKFFAEEQKQQLTLEEANGIIHVASSFLYNEYGVNFGQDQKNPNALLDFPSSLGETIRIKSEIEVSDKKNSIELPHGLTLMGLGNLLFSRTNTVLANNPFKTDMTKPLSSYYINTSRLTYIRINKETNTLEVSSKNYSKYLLKGVRCIDISLIVHLYT